MCVCVGEMCVSVGHGQQQEPISSRPQCHTHCSCERQKHTHEKEKEGKGEEGVRGWCVAGVCVWEVW